MTDRLVDRSPRLERAELVAALVPPPRFERVRLQTYRPDPDQPSQSRAVERLRQFGSRLSQPVRRRRLLSRANGPSGPTGIYLDGGFGVGKTHLLASLWQLAPGRKAFGTFVEYTNLVGALGFTTAVEALCAHSLVCIDEFELDDPGDTVLISTLLARLTSAGVHVAATSNTLPDALGEGRFAADDFVREIQALAARFDVVRVDGQDYRHRGLPQAPDPVQQQRAQWWAAATPGATCDDLDRLVEHLASVHPSRYGALVQGVAAVALTGLHPIHDQTLALRLVVLVDRLYDRDVPVVVSGSPIGELFAPDLLVGGYRKKYLRALSRLTALAREGANLPDGTG